MKLHIKLLIGLLVFNLHTTAFANKKVYDQQIVNAYNVLVKQPARKAALTKKRSHKRQQHASRNRTPQINAVLVAKKQLNKKYRWGGTNPHTGFDCSGLIQYAYKASKVHLPRTAAAQFKHTKRVSMKHLQTGDLIFFHTRRTRARVNHVGIYLGAGKFIHAPRRGKLVSVSDLNSYWRRKAVGAGRV